MITYINRVQGELTVETTVGRSIFELSDARNHDAMRRCFDGVFDRGEPGSYEASSEAPGDLHWYDCRAAPITRDGKVIAAMVVATDITQQKRAAQALTQSERHHREVAESNRRLLHEVNHRVRNNLASLLALVDLAAPRATDAGALADAMRRRINAMTQVHNLLAGANWNEVGLRSLVMSLHDMTQKIAPHEVPVTVSGEDLPISPRQVLPLAMSLSELFTNSVKHGAHRSPTGRLTIAWTVTPGDGDQGRAVRLTWKETGGPPVAGTIRKSVGAELVEGLVTFELGGACILSFPPTGADHILEFHAEAPASA